MKIALAQVFCKWGDPQANLLKIEDFTARAAEQGTEWILFPELTLQGIFKSPAVREVSEPSDGPSVMAVRSMARRFGVAIGFGFSERDPEGRLPFNAYTVADRTGSIVGIYRKNRIPKLELPFWQPCAARPLLELEGIPFGISLCWDNQYPEIPEDYARRGARIVVMPHAWDADALDGEGDVIDYDSLEEIISIHQTTGLRIWKTHPQMWMEFDPHIPAIAARNRVWALLVNQTGQPHPSIRFVGPSFAADPGGRIVACSQDESEQLIHLEIRSD